MHTHTETTCSCRANTEPLRSGRAILPCGGGWMQVWLSRQQKAFITLGSPVVPLLSTSKADSGLASEFRWDRAIYTAYERMLKVRGRNTTHQAADSDATTHAPARTTTSGHLKPPTTNSKTNRDPCTRLLMGLAPAQRARIKSIKFRIN